MIQYKGYTGVFEYDEEYGFFAGHVVGTRDGIYFEGQSVGELEDSMRCAVDAYLDACAEKGRRPSQPRPAEVVQDASGQEAATAQ